jgi:hypothetical protein
MHKPRVDQRSNTEKPVTASSSSSYPLHSQAIMFPTGSLPLSLFTGPVPPGALNPDLIRRHPLRIISSPNNGGLIIQKRYHTDFLTPGSAVGGKLDFDCIGLYAVGNVSLFAPGVPGAQHGAIEQRLQDIRQLNQIIRVADPADRGHLIISTLCGWIGLRAAQSLPAELVAEMASITPSVLESAWHIMLHDVELGVA